MNRYSQKMSEKKKRKKSEKSENKMSNIESLIVWGNEKTVYSDDVMIFAKGSFEYIRNDITDIKTRYIKLGFHLQECKRSKYYECFGYTDFYDFVSANFSMDKGSVSRCINVYLEFADRDEYGSGAPKMFIADKWKDYNYTQLCEMLPMSKKEREKVKPFMSCSQIRELKKSFKAKPCEREVMEQEEVVAPTQPDTQQEEVVASTQPEKEIGISYLNSKVSERNVRKMTRLTRESLELLLEEIVDAVENSEDRTLQFDMVKTVLEGNGLIEVIEE